MEDINATNQRSVLYQSHTLDLSPLDPPPSYSTLTPLDNTDQKDNVQQTPPLYDTIVIAKSTHNNIKTLHNEVHLTLFKHDILFMVTFAVMFFLDFIGVVLCCQAKTCTSNRYGTICGFGFLMIRWSCIIRVVYCHTYICLCLLLTGLFMFVYGLLKHIQTRNVSTCNKNG